nr:lipocalin-like domain-containing protein [Aerococcus sp. Group 2]
MSMRDQLIGTWRLLSYETEKDGEKVYPFGKDAKGFIMYNPDGYMSAQLSKVGRTPYESGDIHTGTTEEMQKPPTAIWPIPVVLKSMKKKGKSPTTWTSP